MRSNPRGFTLVELMVVIAIIAMLIAILLPTLSTARQQALSLKCLSQMRQLGNAFAMYVYDNKGWMPSSDTCGPLYPQNFYDCSERPLWFKANANQTWVGWVDGGPTEPAIQNGTLWKYTQNAALYKCPADFNDYRTRTYSLNTFICEGGSIAPYAGTAMVNYWKVYKVTQVRDAAKTISFAEEGDNRGSAASQAALAGQWNLDGWQQNPIAANIPATWVDTVPSWHRKGVNFAFVDGHAEYWRWADARTVNYLRNDPTWPNPLYMTPNNPDLARIQAAVCTWPQQRAK